MNLHPQIKIEALFVDRVVSIIEEGFDIALRIGPLPNSTLMATKVGQAKMQVCGCPSYFERFGIPQHPEELLNHKLIGLSLGRHEFEWEFKDNMIIKPECQIIVNSISSCLEAARQGWGLARALTHHIGPLVDTGCIQTILGDYEQDPWPIHLLHGHGRQSAAKVRSFIDFASQKLRSDPFLNF